MGNLGSGGFRRVVFTSGIKKRGPEKTSLTIDNENPAFTAFDTTPDGLKKQSIVIHVPVT